MQNHNIDICYIVSHGFAARMVFQTGLLQRLAKEGIKVGVVSPDVEDSMLIKNCKLYDIKLFCFNANKGLFTDEFNFRRKYFLENIKANPALWEKHLLSINGNKSLHPWRHIRPYIYYGAYQLTRRFPSIRTHYLSYEKKLLHSKKSQVLLKEISPKIVVSTYPVNFSEATILHNANLLGIKTIIHLLSWDNITAKGYFPALSSEYITWGNVMTKELMEHYNVDINNIHQTGVPHFDLHVQVKQKRNHNNWIKKTGLRTDKPYLFFGMSSPRFAPNEIDIVEYLAKRINLGKLYPGLQLLVRPHPQNITGNLADKSWLPRLKVLESEKVKLDLPSLVNSKLNYSLENSDMIRLSNLMYGSAIVLNSGSTISIDALMLDKPVLITSFDGKEKLPYWKSARRLIDYTHLKKLVDLGGVEVCKSYMELEKNILTWLSNPNKNRQNRTFTREAECGVDDGQATEKVVNVLTNTLDNIVGIKQLM